MNVTVEDLEKAILDYASNKERIFVAIAGPPASGKTTLCDSLEKSLKKAVTGVSAVPMDGYHYDNAILEQTNTLDRKGSPGTFDVQSLQLLLQHLKHQTAPIAAPVFDRTLDLARSSAKMIDPQDTIILIEGNYLLCECPPWNNLLELFDVTVSINVPIDTLEKRLIQRWLDHNHTPKEAKERTHHNDLPNAQFVIENSSPATYELSN